MWLEGSRAMAWPYACTARRKSLALTASLACRTLCRNAACPPGLLVLQRASSSAAVTSADDVEAMLVTEVWLVLAAVAAAAEEEVEVVAVRWEWALVWRCKIMRQN